MRLVSRTSFLPRVSSSPQKTTIVAISVLAVLAVLQLVVAFAIFIRRAALVNPSPGLAVHSFSAPTPAATPATKPASTPSPAVTATKKATSSPSPAAPSTPAPTVREALITRSREAREKGDMTGALAGLREAQKSSPDDPLIISEMAVTYEQMGLVDKALSQWRRVVAAGEKAGDLYGIAAEKLKTGIGADPAAIGRDADGLQPGSTLGFAEMQKNYEEPAEGGEKVTLRAAIKSRAAATVAAGDVNIQVVFYDLINNQEVEQTTAKVTSEWVTTPPDWQGDGIEILSIAYLSKPKSSSDPESSSEDRKYLGYIVRVYYKNELQDVRAEPVKLLQYFPPPVTLQSEIPQ